MICFPTFLTPFPLSLSVTLFLHLFSPAFLLLCSVSLSIALSPSLYHPSLFSYFFFLSVCLWCPPTMPSVWRQCAMLKSFTFPSTLQADLIRFTDIFRHLDEYISWWSQSFLKFLSLDNFRHGKTLWHFWRVLWSDLTRTQFSTFFNDNRARPHVLARRLLPFPTTEDLLFSSASSDLRSRLPQKTSVCAPQPHCSLSDFITDCCQHAIRQVLIAINPNSKHREAKGTLYHINPTM